MDKELIDKAWACLPREFKEEVKKYHRILHEQHKEYDKLHFDNARAKVQERIVTLEYFFGKHNLTSDAEGEEMLTVSRKRVQEIYTQNQNEIIRENVSSSDKDCYETVNEVLKTLFGSKCLPDEPAKEPQPAEPKESPRQFYRVMGTDEHGRQVVIPIPPQLAGPYDISKERTEPEASTCTETYTDDCSSQDSYISPAPINFDEIERRDRNYQRLNIATQMASAYIIREGMAAPSIIATIAFQLADVLLHEVEKGGLQ